MVAEHRQMGRPFSVDTLAIRFDRDVVLCAFASGRGEQEYPR